MGSKLGIAAAPLVIYNKMLVIGGCELALEKNPYSSLEVISLTEGGKVLNIEKF